MTIGVLFLLGVAFVSCFVCEHKSQSGESEDLYRHFWSEPAPFTNGQFVEIGGYDGVTFSNSWFFEKCLNWRGVLVEGHPALYRKMQKNRPSAVNLNMAVCSQRKLINYTLNASPVSGAVEFMPESFKSHWRSLLRVDNTIEVFCGPLGHQLCLLGIVNIDFFSLDVEGAEWQVLQTLDFNLLNVHVLLVEADRHDTEKNERVRRYMTESQGFILNQSLVARSDVFVNPSYEKRRGLMHPSPCISIIQK